MPAYKFWNTDTNSWQYIATGLKGDTGAAGPNNNLDGETVDLTTPQNDDLLQRKSGQWVNRTPAQVKTDLNVTAADTAAVAKAGGTMTGQLLLPDGSTSAPAFAFANNTNMGRRRSSNNNQRDVTNGVDVTNYASTLVTQLVPALFNQQFRLGQKFVDFDTLGADYTVTSSDGALIITASSSGSYNLNLPATSGSLYFITTDIVADPVILPGIGATVAADGGGTYRAVVVAYSTVIGGHILFASA